MKDRPTFGDRTARYMRRVGIAAAAVMIAATAALVPATGARGGVIKVAAPQVISGLTTLPPEGAVGWCGSPAGMQDWEFDQSLAVDPHNPDRLAVAWVQDAYDGIVVGASTDGGSSWEKTVVSPVCVVPGQVSSDDPSLSFGPDGVLYLSWRLIQSNHLASQLLVNRSLDGGRTWSAPVVVDAAALPLAIDVTQVVADPNRPGVAYVLWGKAELDPATMCAGGAPAIAAFKHYVSRTDNGGVTWSPPSEVPATVDFSVGQLVFLRDGTLLDVIVELPNAAPCVLQGPTRLVTRRLTEAGWSPPSLIAQEADGFDDVSGHSTAVAPDGTVYVSWQTRLPGSVPLPFSVMYSKSVDGGMTWQAPTAVAENLVGPAERAAATAPTLQRPALAVAADGTVAVGFYDRRNATDPEHRNATDYWLRHSHDGGRNWREDHVAGPFDRTLADARLRNPGFLGCCQGLAPIPGGFAASFALGPPFATHNNDFFFSQLRLEGRINRLRNGSFEHSSNGASPDAWSSTGSTAYEDGGSDGLRSVSTGPGGSWTSEPIPIAAGSSYQASVAVAGAGGTLLVQQLTADGTVLASTPQLLVPGSVFTVASLHLTALAGATHVRIVLLGGLTGKTTFDDVGLFSG